MALDLEKMERDFYKKLAGTTDEELDGIMRGIQAERAEADKVEREEFRKRLIISLAGNPQMIDWSYDFYERARTVILQADAIIEQLEAK